MENEFYPNMKYGCENINCSIFKLNYKYILIFKIFTK